MNKTRTAKGHTSGSSFRLHPSSFIFLKIRSARAIRPSVASRTA